MWISIAATPIIELTRNILHITLREGVEHDQLGDQGENNDPWARPNSRRPRLLRQRLAAILAEGTGILADTGVESNTWAEKEKFSVKVPTLLCEDCGVAAEEAREHTDQLLSVLMWSDSFQLESGRAGACGAWRKHQQWKTWRVHLGTKKDISHVELYLITEPMNVVL